MRIEILSGFGRSISDFESNISSLANEIEDTISELRAIERNVDSISGSPSQYLHEVNRSLDSRLRAEKRKLDAVNGVLKQTKEFYQHAIEIDRNVARVVDSNQQKFFQKYERLEADTDPGKPFWEGWAENIGNVISAVKEAFVQAGEWISDAADWVSGLAANVWEYVKAHAFEFIVGTVLIALAAAITVLTGGAGFAVGLFLTEFFTTLFEVTAGAAAWAAISGLFAMAKGGAFFETFGEEFASGYLIGSIFALGKSVFNFTKYVRKSNANPKVKVINTGYEGETRPKWTSSERTFTEKTEGFAEQISFDESGNVCSRTTKGSVRPDGFKNSTLVSEAVDVKNYNLDNKKYINNLVNTIKKQYAQRANQLPNLKNSFTNIFKGKLPTIKTIQSIALDVRGLQISDEVLAGVMGRIMKATNYGIKKFYIIK